MSGVLLAQQTGTPTPTPTPVPFSSTCTDAGVDANTLITNGDFEYPQESESIPMGWNAAESGIVGILRSQVVPGTEIINHFVGLTPNASIVQVISPYTGIYTRFQIRFCAVALDGRVEIYIGGSLRGSFPVSLEEGLLSGEFTSSSGIPLSIGLGSTEGNRTIQVRYVGTGVAYVDNVQLIPVLHSGSDDEELDPTPTPILPTPEPTEPPGPTPTFTPTIPAGTATPTPTPALVAGSLQISANPPMLSVSPDDFINPAGGITKQVLLNFDVIGSNGEPIDLGRFENVRVRITTDQGSIQQFDNNNYTSVTGWEKYEDIRDAPIYYFPTGPFDGTVRIIIDLQFRTPGGERQEIRGVLSFIQRLERSASLIGATGSFNPAANYSSGRKPGDRGFRPDLRTNLFFKERLD
jgi:hypothetical protein